MALRDPKPSTLMTSGANRLGASVLLAAAVAVVGTLSTVPARAQAVSNLPQLLASADTLGGGWTIMQQGADDELKAFSPAPIAGAGAVYSNRPMLALVLLGQYADRATALAAPGFSAPGGYWGAANVSFQPITGFGDANSYRVRPPALKSGSGVSFIDGNVVVFVRDDGFDSQQAADTYADRLAHAEDALLKGNTAAASPPASAVSPTSGSGAISSLEASPDIDQLQAFGATLLVPYDGQEPFADFEVERVFGDASGYSITFGEGLPDAQNESSATVRALQTSGVSSADPRYFTRCNPSAAYCAWTSGQERFLGLRVKNQNAVAAHTTATPDGNPEIWSVDWLDPASGMTYTLHVEGDLAAAYGTGVSPNNRTGAEQLASVADQLVTLQLAPS